MSIRTSFDCNDNPEALREKGMVYEQCRDLAFGEQLQVIAELIHSTEQDLALVDLSLEAGVSKDYGRFTVSLDTRMQVMLTTALQLVGFFSDEYGQIAKAAMLDVFLPGAADARATTSEEETRDAQEKIEALLTRRTQDLLLGGSYGSYEGWWPEPEDDGSGDDES